MSRAPSPLDGRMIFLVGARRSGTNWLQRVVGAHPEIALVPSETYLFSHGIKQLRERLHHGALGSTGTSFVYMDHREMVRTLRDLCDRVFLPFLEAAPGRSLLAERTPDHVRCLDVIGEIYPDAAVVHIVRDGRDVARSLIGQAWRTAPGSIEKAAEEWRTSVEAGEAAGRSLARYRLVRYESLLADPRAQVEELYAWLGVDASEQAVSAALIEAEAKFNEDPGAPGIAAGKWRESFSHEDLSAFDSVAGETLARLGYDTTVEPGGSPSEDPGLRSDRADRPRRRRSLKRVKAPADARASQQRALIAQVIEVQHLLDQVVGAVSMRRVDRLREMSTPSLWVRVVAPGESWKGRGEAAWEKLDATIQNDPALDGRQVDGDVHAAIPTSTAVMTFEAPDGSMHLRALAVSVQLGRIERLVYYRFPLATAP
ncbi:MAG: sulfotransferase family protein [Actinomycetota bacterium]